MTEKLRVLHVIDGLGGSGGAETRMVEEVLALAPRVDQMVVRLFEYDDLDERLRGAGVDVRSLDLRSDFASFNWPIAAWRLARIIRRFNATVVHTSLFAANLSGQLAAGGTDRPVVSTMTGSGDLNLMRADAATTSRRAAVLRMLARKTAQLGRARWRAVTEDTKSSTCASMGINPARVTVIGRAVDARRVDATPDRARFGLPDGPLFVNVARHHPYKGQQLLIEAFAHVRAELPHAQLAVAGRPGPLTPALEKLIVDHGLSDCVTLLGFRPDADVLLASADVFLFSSLVEGIATAVLEAVASGVPAVAFDIPSIREVTGPGALATLVPVGDVARFGEAAVTAFQTRDDREGIAARRRWVLEHHAISGVAAGVEALLSSAVSDFRPRWKRTSAS